MALRRKNIRLDRKAYEIPSQIFSVTICACNRRPLLEIDAQAEIAASALKTGPFGNGTERFAYCLMPDHVHLLVSACNGNLTDLINGWKRYTGGCFRMQGLDGPFWQRGFYDHALRSEEDIQKTAEYMVYNPVRAGLVENWREYPYAWHRWM